MTMSDNEGDFDPEQYVSRWKEHISELERLKWHLDPEDYDELDDIKNRLHEMVEVCADNGERIDEEGIMDANKKTLSEQ